MTPAEIEKYKSQMLKDLSNKANKLSQQYDIKIDETTLPDFEIKAPPKDLKRLSMIPLQAPSRMELMAGLQTSKKQLEAAASPAVVQEVKKNIATQSGSELQATAAGLWYQDKPIEALLTAVGSVEKNNDAVIAWNNLAALFNMAGLEEKSIPILMHHLGNLPDNSLLLNNIGQAFLGLGDINQAEGYFKKCLESDPLNPEANRSMGMINVFRKQYDAAQAYFEKELEVAHRRSTLTHLAKMGRKVNLNAIRARRTGVPQRDFFSEINLAKFELPDLPELPEQSRPWWAENAGYMKSLQAELMFWMEAGKITPEMQQAEGRKSGSIYSGLVNEMLSELGSEFSPLLGMVTENEMYQLTEEVNSYWAKRNATICPQPPSTPGGSAELFAAYEKKCCDMLTPIIADYMKSRNSFVKNRFQVVNSRWKMYINGMINIVRLDPSPANKLLVYKTVADYFSFLITTVSTLVSFEDPPMGCHVKMTTAESEAIIAANHDIDINCPAWLNLDIDLNAVKLKADCSKYAIEGGKVVVGSYEKNFKTGTSTLAAGVGVEQKFGSLAKVGAKQMLYVSFDNNNQFSDFGLKGQVEGKVGIASEQLVVDGIGKVGSTLAGVEGGYTLGINSGFKGTVKGKGILTEYIK